MKIACALTVLACATTAAAQNVTSRDIRFFSEGIQCYGRVYLPKGFGPDAKAPAVVLAPGWMQTAASIDKYAARFAARGLVAMAIKNKHALPASSLASARFMVPAIGRPMRQSWWTTIPVRYCTRNGPTIRAIRPR